MKNEVVMNRMTTGVAVAGMGMPAWMPSLDAVSGAAGLAVPILSAIWLGVQIARFVQGWIKGAKE